MKHREVKQVLRTLIRKEYHLLFSRLTCTLHSRLQFLTYTVHFSIAVFKQSALIWPNSWQKLHSSWSWPCFLQPVQYFSGSCEWCSFGATFWRSFGAVCSLFMGQTNGAHSEPPSDAHSELSAAHTEPPDAHTEPLDLFCHFHDNFLDKHHVVVLNEGCFWFELFDIIW